MSVHLLQLSAPLFVKTPLGNATAHFLTMQGDFLLWGCFQDDTGECWWWRNHQIRLRASISDGRYKTSPIELSAGMTQALGQHRKRYPSKRRK